MSIRLHARLRKTGHLQVPSETASRRFVRSSSEEELRQIRQQKREKRRQVIQYMHSQGLSLRSIARTLGFSKTTVARYLRDEGSQVRARQASIIDPYLGYLENRWNEGCENAHQLWREIRKQGFPGSTRQVTRWARGRRTKPAPSTPKKYRKQMQVQGETPARCAGVLLPDHRTFSRSFVQAPAVLSTKEHEMLGYLCQDVTVASAYKLTQQLRAMISKEHPEAFTDWFEQAKASGIATISRFAQNLSTDKEAVMAAMRLPWSNGQVEGQITKQN
jgi:transposase